VGADRVALDQHTYFAFDMSGSTDIVPYLTRPCGEFGTVMNTSQQKFGFAIAGEWSLGFNDCMCSFHLVYLATDPKPDLVGGFMLNTPADQHVTKDCTQWDQWEDYTPTQKQNLMTFAMSHMDALQVCLFPVHTFIANKF
jgi:glucan 1,3-beta-glucosidase